MKRFSALLLLGAALAFAQDHHQMVNEHGDGVMGFSHEKTTHHFELSYEGGAIDVRANDVNDTQSRDEIRSHFRHIAQMFAEGNFNAPMLVHNREDVSGHCGDVAIEGSAALDDVRNIAWRAAHRHRG